MRTKTAVEQGGKMEYLLKYTRVFCQIRFSNLLKKLIYFSLGLSRNRIVENHLLTSSIG
jgi:hypothetical protein